MKNAENLIDMRVHTYGNSSSKKKRDSNIELMRIVMMILIIAHHYVVNSGITELYDFSNITNNMFFLQGIGAFGKTMINCFILITGYFSIKGKFSFKKVIRLYLEIKFYKIVIYTIFIASGIDTFSIKGFIKAIFNVIYGVNIGFPATFFLLYLLTPFINGLIKKLNKKQYSVLLGILLFYFTIISTFSLANNTFNEISWYIVVYLIGAFIRLYPSKYDKSTKIWSISTIICIIISIISILGIDVINHKFNVTVNPYYFMENAHKLLAVLTSISLFMLFKNINIKSNKVINTIASTTFGVLLIHTNGDVMRKWLWQDIFNVKGQYSSQSLCIHIILTIFIIYAACVCIDLLRSKFIEKRLFKYLENKKKFNEVCNKIDSLFNI